MAVWKCQSCGSEMETRCRPSKCKECGATEEEMVKSKSNTHKK